tara:strand:+ start:229 stop:711 length:483 start_codon:yes stop_codon:yes gene_type:complete
MVDIQSKEVIDKVSDELKIQPAMSIPRSLANNIQLTYDINRSKCANFSFSQGRTTTGTGTIFTSNANKRTFLTHVSLSAMANATADNTSYNLNIVNELGVTTPLIRFEKITTTAFQDSMALPLTHPIEIEAGSSVQFSSTFSAGASVMGATVSGFEIDPQ